MHSSEIDGHERWLEVAGAPEYDVSTLGRVRRRDTGRQLALTPRANGYISVSLSIEGAGKKRFYAHRLVAQAFISGFFPWRQVNHKNFIRSANGLSNLDVLTARDNLRYSRDAGRYPDMKKVALAGENSPASKLKLTQVLEIRRLHANGSTLRELSDVYGVCTAQINNVVTRKSWSAVQ